MAKGKHSTALFEVIHSANRPERVAQSLRTPKWWFKGRQTPPSQGAPAESRYSEPDPAPPAPVAAEPVQVSTPPPPRHSFDSDRRHGRSSAVHFDFDRSRKEITLRLRYTTAVVSGFAVCVLIAMSYVIGRHIGKGPRTALASEQPNVQELMQQPPQPGVANVARPHAHPSQQLSSNTEAPRHRIEAPQQAPTTLKPHPQQPASLIPAGIESRLPRTISLNYVIIQTYPPEERQAAEAARDYLTRNGIPCTLEKVPDFARNPSWSCLVGTAGFAHISSPEYREYVDNILRLGSKFKSSNFDRWNPSPKKWTGQ